MTIIGSGTVASIAESKAAFKANDRMADVVVIDGKGHLLGRLASIVAKQLLEGKKIVVVRTESMMISGSCKFNEVQCCVCTRRQC